MAAMHARLISALAVSVLVVNAATAAPSATTVPLKDALVPHRAVYNISLMRTDEGSGVTSADGRMVFEITGNACDGYNMRQRMVVNIGDEQGNVGVLDFRITTFESGDGSRYSFDSKTMLNDAVVEAVKGEARRKPSGLEVKLEVPAAKTVQIPGKMLFPSQHLQAILTAASADRSFVAAKIYEGAGTGEASDAASAAIGRAVRTGEEGPLRAGLRRWPVSVGYFDGERKSATALGEETPTYQMRFKLYENGVTNDLVLDYGDYALSGSLAEIEALKAEDCPPR